MRRTNDQLYWAKIFEIEKALASQKVAPLGLFTGSMGSALFYYALHKTTQETKFKNKCKSILNREIRELSSADLSHSFCSGFTGIAWGINFFVKNGFIKAKANSYFADIDDYIFSCSQRDFETAFYDFLHGGSGAAIYAIGRSDGEKAREFLKLYLKYLHAIRHEDKAGYKWADIFSDISRKRIGDESRFGLGLAHGVPGIISILLKIYQLGIERSSVSKLIEGSLSWIRSVKGTSKTKVSMYPSWVIGDEPDDQDSRLAWCYGDLGIAMVFLISGKVMKNSEWTKEGKAIVHGCLKRLSQNETGIIDAGFCHGTAGVAHMFRKLHGLSGISNCWRVYLHWLQQTLDMAKFEDGLGGYKAYKMASRDGERMWISDDSLLEGVTGIGLVFLTYLGFSENWDECLLLPGHS